MRTTAYFAVGVLAALVLLELALRVLPTSTATKTGYYIDPVIVTYPPNHEFVSSFGWNFANSQHHRTNNYGFLTSKDFFVDGSAIALVGDSYVDASFLAESDRLAGRLEEELNGTPVYALGSPGSSLLDYAERIRFAYEEFAVRQFVVIVERGDVRQSLCGSGNVQGPCLAPSTLEPRVDLLPSKSDPLRDLLRESALAQYLVSQLRLSPAAVKQMMLGADELPVSASGPPTNALSDSAFNAVVDAFFTRIAPLRDARIVFVFDCDHAKLNRGEAASDEYRDRLMSIARDRGALTLDVEPLFREHLSETGLRLEMSPSDAHWNVQANRLVAGAVGKMLSEKIIL